MSLLAPTEEKGPLDAKSIPIRCLWERDFPGTSSASPFTNQHLANIVALQGPSRPCSVRICSYRLCPITGPSVRCPTGEARSALSSSSNPKGPYAMHCPMRANLQQNNSKKRSLGRGRGGKNSFKTWTHQETVSMATSPSYSSSSLF